MADNDNHPAGGVVEASLVVFSPKGETIVPRAIADRLRRAAERARRQHLAERGLAGYVGTPPTISVIVTVTNAETVTLPEQTVIAP